MDKKMEKGKNIIILMTEGFNLKENSKVIKNGTGKDMMKMVM